jgi:LAS superfamily LD-carboxypeptidase LdcB
VFDGGVSSSQPARVAGLLIVIVAIGAAIDQESPASSPSTPPVQIPVHRSERREGLDRALAGALRAAAADAADDGVALHVNSGRRSPERQEQLFREAIAKYGSPAEAARWVATADTSPHVSGDAVDIGPSGAAAWLSAHGAEYGLCQIYGNEPWHYELRPEAIERGCPPMYPDPTHDPRMQPATLR